MVADISTRTVYIDFDSCYYNAARRIYGIHPWTVITNKYGHMISVPYWLEGHFGAKKIAYFAPPTKTTPKVRCFVEIFNVDKRLSKERTVRDTIAIFVEGKLEEVRAITPEARLVHKDSIITEVEPYKIRLLEKAAGLPCTIGIGSSEEEAKDDCKVKKLRKRNNKLVNYILFLFWTVLMIAYYIVSRLKRRER